MLAKIAFFWIGMAICLLLVWAAWFGGNRDGE